MVSPWAEKRDYRGQIAYFFENGHKHETQTQQAINELSLSRVEARYHSLTFAGKRDVRPLQTADILAYEWQKELQRLNMAPSSRSIRRSLDSLLEKPHMYQHFGAEDLHRFFSQGAEALLEKARTFHLVE